jgi:hypothetical protein
MLRHWTYTLVVSSLLVSCIAARPKPAKPEASKTDANGQTVPPSDAQWTIYCAGLDNPNHIDQANKAKAELVKLTGMKDFYVIHQQGQSVIYYGFYRTIDSKDPKEKKETERAQRDRKYLETLTDTPGKPGGARMFNRVGFEPIAEPDPVAPAEWNVVNSGGYWSWQIAAYKDSPRRKQAAVDAVRDARARGVTAYFYHGETTSSVLIGAWPKDAVHGDAEEDVGKATDPTEDVIVMNQPVRNQDKLQFHNREGDRIRDLTPTRQAVDPSLVSTMAQFPTHSINGQTMVTRSNGKAIEDPAFLVIIKKPEPTLLRAAPEPPELLAQPPVPAAGIPAAAQQPATPGAGRLRSIGDQ